MELASLWVGIGADLRGLEKGLTQAERKVRDFSNRMKDLGKTLTVALTLPLAGLGVAAGKAAVDFESSFAGIRKTVDMTEAEFARLAAANRDLAKQIPVSVDELNRIGELAGQMGIEGVDNILKFEETIAQLTVTTDLTADAAALSFAQIANVVQLPQQQIDRLGAVVVGLGNNFATVESQIVEFTQRIAGAGHIAGLNVAEIAGIGTAFASLGVQAEAGGTAVQKVLISMTSAVAQGGGKLQDFADVAGMTAEQFAETFRGDAATAFVEFVEGLGRQGDQAVNSLAKLGLADQRLTRGFLAAANAGDLLRRAVSQANEEFRDNTALVNEAAQRFETAESQLQILRNRARDVAITLGDALVPALLATIDSLEPLFGLISSLASTFANLPTAVQSSVVAFGAFAAALGPVLYLVGSLAAVLPKVVMLMGGLAGPIGLVTAALAIGSAAWVSWRVSVQKEAEAAKKAIDGVRDSVQEMTATMAENRFREVQAELSSARELERRQKELREQLPTLKIGSKERGAAVRELEEIQNALRGVSTEHLAEEYRALVRHMTDLRLEAERAGKAVEDGLSGGLEQTGASLEELQGRVRTLLQIFNELGARGADRSGVAQELVALERQIESIVRAQGDARNEALADALRLSRQIRDTLNEADPFRNFRPEGLATLGTHLTEEGKARLQEERRQRGEFLDLGGRLSPVAARGRSGAITPDADPAGGLMGKLTEIGNEVGAQIMAIVAKFGPLAAAAAALKPVFDGLMERLKPVFAALAEPLRIIGHLLGAVIAPVLRLLAPPLRILATAVSYVIEGFGYLIRAIGQASGALSFGLAGKGLRRSGQDLIDTARDSRKALRGAGDDVADFGATVRDITQSISNVPQIFDIALRRRMAMMDGAGAGGGSGGGGSGGGPQRPPDPRPPMPPGGDRGEDGRGPIRPPEREPLAVHIHNPPPSMDVGAVVRQVEQGIIRRAQRGGSNELTLALRGV